ncbi:MAG TPA: hypothetical protein VM261_22695 [Kofleriaceae bacterium]|nr:hypothetical protein [Kofleriaceae bacterium]
MSTLDRDPDDPAHAPVRAALAETGADLQPRPGWEAKVWERIDAGAGSSGGKAQLRNPARRRAVWLVGGGLLAAAAIALVIWRGGDGGRERVVVADASLEIRRSAQVMRGAAAAPGDTAVVRLSGGAAASGGAVWIYRGEATLVVTCDAGRVAGPACRRDGAGVVVEVVLDRPGTYHVLTITGGPSGAAPATVDEALATLTTGGARFRHDELDVR